MKTKSGLNGNVERLAEQETTSSLFDINNNLITPEWAAEFRGFFWGEGCFYIHPTFGNGRSFAITTKIELRKDDEEVLKEFQRRLGGKISYWDYKQHKGSNPTIRWWVARMTDCQRLVKLLTSNTNLPFNKQKQLNLWTRALELKQNRALRGAIAPYFPEEREELNMICEQLKLYKRYQET
jgi:hypothetical protein